MLKQGVKSEGECVNGSRFIAGHLACRNGEKFFELTADERAVCIWQMNAANNFFLAKLCSGCLSNSFGMILIRLRIHQGQSYILLLVLEESIDSKTIGVDISIRNIVLSICQHQSIIIFMLSQLVKYYFLLDR